MQKVITRVLPACVLFVLAAAMPGAHAPRSAHVLAAEFDIDAGRVVLRRLQYCVDCGSALLVTDVHSGELVRCPDCGAEQPRLENQYLLTQLYQICKLCSGPLNPEGHSPGDVVECATCLTRQPLVADAFMRRGAGAAAGDAAGGQGFRPGFPPGTGKKTLLFSPNRPDAEITAVPMPPEELENTEKEAMEETSESLALRKIPSPPPGFVRERKTQSTPPLPDIAPPGAAAAASTSHAERVSRSPSGAIEVPAVTADLFGGGAARRTPGTPETRIGESNHITTGEIAARMDGQPIYVRDIDLVVLPVMERLRKQASPADAETLALREKELRREVLGRLIDRELAAREAAAIGHTPNPAALRAREAELAQMLAGSGIDLRKEAERDVIMEDMRRRFAEKLAPVTPNEVREFYRQHTAELQQPRLLALDQLVVYEERGTRPDRRPAREIAFEIASALEHGALFDDLRKRCDEFLPGAALPHAEPVLKPEDAYSRQVLAAGGDLREGGVFGPVPLSGMYLFGKVASVRPAGTIPFAEAEKTIRARLESEATERAFAHWLSALRARAKIEIPK